MYSGTAKYYVCDDYPTIEAAMRANTVIVPYETWRERNRPKVKRTTNATIKIAPYKDHPKVYNIWFDNVGLGIDLNDNYFPGY